MNRGKSLTGIEDPIMMEDERLYREGTSYLDIDPQKAIQLLTKSLELSPSAPPALYNRAVAYARLGQDSEAVADIAQLERIAPKIGRQLRAEMKLAATPYVDMAQAEVAAMNYSAAIRKCQSALAYDPEYGNAWVVMGIAHC